MLTGNIRNIALLAFGALALGSLRTLDAQELKPIRVSLSLGSAQLPLWAAHDAGLFAKHGLNAECSVSRQPPARYNSSWREIR